jgi:hypothetical protein
MVFVFDTEDADVVEQKHGPGAELHQWYFVLFCFPSLTDCVSPPSWYEGRVETLYPASKAAIISFDEEGGMYRYSYAAMETKLPEGATLDYPFAAEQVPREQVS